MNLNFRLTVTGFNGATQVATQVVTTSALFTFNFNNITSVTFNSSGGIAVHGNSGNHFAMDNLAATGIPKPSAALL